MRLLKLLAKLGFVENRGKCAERRRRSEKGTEAPFPSTTHFLRLVCLSHTIFAWPVFRLKPETRLLHSLAQRLRMYLSIGWHQIIRDTEKCLCLHTSTRAVNPALKSNIEIPQWFALAKTFWQRVQVVEPSPTTSDFFCGDSWGVETPVKCLCWPTTRCGLFGYRRIFSLFDAKIYLWRESRHLVCVFTVYTVGGFIFRCGFVNRSREATCEGCLLKRSENGARGLQCFVEKMFKINSWVFLDWHFWWSDVRKMLTWIMCF